MPWSQIDTFVRDKKGRVYINPAKDYTQPFELGSDRPNTIVTLPPGAEVGPIVFTAKQDGPIEVFYVKVLVTDDSSPVPLPVQDYDIDWFVEHPGKRKQFSNRFIPLIATAGDAGRPYVLPETIFIPAVQSLNVTFRNLDTVNERRVELVFGGIKFYPNSAPDKLRSELWGYIERRERTYCYWQTSDSDVILTALEENLSRFFTVPDDTDLEIFKLTAEATGRFGSRLIDGQNDRAVFTFNMDASLTWGGHIPTPLGGGIGGSGGVFPYRWSTSYLVRRSTKLEIQFTDRSNAPNTVKPVLGGRKVAYAS